MALRELYLIRPGEYIPAEANSLTEVGKRQVNALADILLNDIRDPNNVKIFYLNYSRPAKETALIIASYLFESRNQPELVEDEVEPLQLVGVDYRGAAIQLLRRTGVRDTQTALVVARSQGTSVLKIGRAVALEETAQPLISDDLQLEYAEASKLSFVECRGELISPFRDRTFFC